MAAHTVVGIDRAWLARLARDDPIRHAFAVWDLERFPEKVAFVTLVEDGAPTAYLLIWQGGLPLRAVQWIGSAREPGPLMEAMPTPPLLGSVPLELLDQAARRVGGTPGVVQLRALDPERAAPPEVEGRARPLSGADLEALRTFANSSEERLVRGYRELHPANERIFGAFQGPRLASVARIQAALPAVWIIGGVATLPEFRNLGLATDLTRLAIRQALAAGARPALYVLESNDVARRLYDRLGFTVLERRGWLDASQPGGR